MILQDSTSHILHGTAVHKSFLLNPHMVASLWTTTFLMLKTKTNKNFTFFSEEIQNSSASPVSACHKTEFAHVFQNFSIFFSKAKRNRHDTKSTHTQQTYHYQMLPITARL